MFNLKENSGAVFAAVIMILIVIGIIYRMLAN